VCSPANVSKPDIKGGKGGIDALFINDQTPKPPPGPHEALVKIKAFGLNRMDVSCSNSFFVNVL
jgi:NADPH:quinone reductase-like Zn-dependent oxidoreductase